MFRDSFLALGADDPCLWHLVHQEVQKRFAGGRFTIPKDTSVAGDRCLRILESVGSRAKNLNYLGVCRSVTSACVIWRVSTNVLASTVAPSLWIVSRYLKENPTMLKVDSEFETVWGWRACEISETWRKHNDARKLEAGQTQKKITAGGSSSQTIGRHFTFRPPPVTTIPSSTSSSIVPVDDMDDSHQPSSSTGSRYPDDSERRTLPSLKSVGLLDSFDNRRTNNEPKSVLPPLSKAREW